MVRNLLSFLRSDQGSLQPPGANQCWNSTGNLNISSHFYKTRSDYQAFTPQISIIKQIALIVVIETSITFNHVTRIYSGASVDPLPSTD